MPEFDVSLLTRAVPQADEGLGVRVTSVPRSLLDGRVDDDVEPLALGRRFIGQVVMASDGDQLVVVGHVTDQVVQVWCGSGRQLGRVAEFDSPVPAGGLVALVRFRREWHLFARSERGRTSHLISTDLCTWTQLMQVASSFPAFAVAGAAVCGADLLLAGRVFVDNTAFGWGLLRSDGRAFEARPVPLPLATQLGVVGPVVRHDGDVVLLLDSGHNRTVATSSGAGWTLGLLVPPIQVLSAFVDGEDLWLAGTDDDGQACVARVQDEAVLGLPPGADLGRVRGAIVHQGCLVVAREC
ncbi:MAG: hypothetical protein AB7L17_17665 [Ilumatobacteraceae bacterium]